MQGGGGELRGDEDGQAVTQQRVGGCGTSAQFGSRRNGGRRASSSSGRRKLRVRLAPMHLLSCIFPGSLVFDDQIEEVSQQVLSLLRADGLGMKLHALTG